MKLLIALMLMVIFASLAIIHFYWALGGRRSVNAAVPVFADNQQPLFKPGPLPTLIVGLGLLCFAGVILLQMNMITVSWVPAQFVRYISWGITAIFILRAIGDFKYVGFFKSVKATDFGRMDSQYYSPLCLLISILTSILHFY